MAAGSMRAQGASPRAGARNRERLFALSLNDYFSMSPFEPSDDVIANGEIVDAKTVVLIQYLSSREQRSGRGFIAPVVPGIGCCWLGKVDADNPALCFSSVRSLT